MPKETFHNLPSSKQQKLVDRFLREFSIHRYDDASISAVLKDLGIAKGSFYQYFESKLALFLYLQEICGTQKAKYVMQVKREDFPDFWQYFRKLYEEGIQFDQQHPLMSNFLHQIIHHIHSPTIKKLYDTWLDQIMAALTAWVQHEVDLGLFRKDIPVKSMAFFLFKITTSIMEYMRLIYGLEVEENIKKGLPVYADENGTTLMKAVDEYILLLQSTFDNQ